MNISQRSLLQLKVTLQRVTPPIWRRLLVPANFSFWDLHVALQDSMGWWDSHLHAFRAGSPGARTSEVIGIPTDYGFEEDETLAGWEVPVRNYLAKPGDAVLYEYDFGDGWEHEVVLEEAVSRIKGQRYPKCIAGERACPPEDCGGPYGYGELLRVLADPAHEDHEEMLEWVGLAFDPERFDSSAIRFTSPKRRWREVFEEP